jgi:hypothetical protein
MVINLNLRGVRWGAVNVSHKAAVLFVLLSRTLNVEVTVHSFLPSALYELLLSFMSPGHLIPEEAAKTAHLCKPQSRCGRRDEVKYLIRQHRPGHAAPNRSIFYL